MEPAGRTRKTGPGGVRAAIALLLLIPILVPLFAAALIWLSERDASRAAEDKVVAAARVVGGNIRQLVDSTLERLERMDEALGPNPADFAPRAAPGDGVMFTGLYDANGLTITRRGERGASVADNPEFKAMAAGAPTRIVPLLGQVGAIRIFGISRRIERNGVFAGAQTAFYGADTLSNLWATLALGPDSTLSVIRKDGELVVRFPVPEEEVDARTSELFTRQLPRAPSGVYQVTSSLDGIARNVAYESLDDLGLVVTASMSRAGTTDAFWSRVGSTALVAAPVFLALVFACGWAVLLLMRHDRNRAELQQALAQNRVLFQEIHHRVKNNLQAVAAMVKLQQAPAAMKEDLTRRIAAMTAVHQHIYESDQFGVLDTEAYLAKLLAGLRDAAPPGVELDWRLAPLLLHADQALPLGLIVNEVVSNAFKHAFPEGRAGKVFVALERPLEGNDAILSITDNGVGMAETPAGGRGLGARLIAALATQLEGKQTVVRENGVRFELRFPASIKT